MLEELSMVLLAVAVVLCAWAYPRLNAWVYRRRIERDEALAAEAGHGGLGGAKRHAAEE